MKQSIVLDDYPSCTPVYEERVGQVYSEFHSSTEKYALRKTEKQLQVQRIDNALQVLSEKERKLIEARYFDPNEPVDGWIYDQLGWSQASYYRVKRQAIYKLALALNMI